jgi:HlyD family secretion protein
MGNTVDKNLIKKRDKSLAAALAIIIVVVVCLSIIGFLLIRPAEETVQGQADATQVRISGKLPGRVVKLYVEEGAYVHKGDTLACIHSSTADAKLFQAKAMETVAASQNQKVDNGTRSQIIKSAFDLWQQAKAAETISKKTYDRMQNLFTQGVVSEQKRDEAKAAFDASTAQTRAAKSQYDLALEGAQKEDKAAASAMTNAARGSVMEVKSLLEDQFLIAPCDGEISDVYPHEGELVALGAPIMTLLRLDDMWVTFNVRETYLNDMTMGKEINVMIPALAETKTKLKIYYIRDMGSYAVWSATKASGQYDTKTFQIKARPVSPIKNFRPGMSVILTDKFGKK